MGMVLGSTAGSAETPHSQPVLKAAICTPCVCSGHQQHLRLAILALCGVQVATSGRKHQSVSGAGWPVGAQLDKLGC